MAEADPRRATLIASLQQRYAEACRRDDGEAKQALFKEAVYLNIQPDLLEAGVDASPPA